MTFVEFKHERLRGYRIDHFPDTLIEEGRRVGNSTRLINWYIDQLFKGKEVCIVDHYRDDETISVQRNKYMVIAVARRLLEEHRILTYRYPESPDPRTSNNFVTKYLSIGNHNVSTLSDIDKAIPKSAPITVDLTKIQYEDGSRR